MNSAVIIGVVIIGIVIVVLIAYALGLFNGDDSDDGDDGDKGDEAPGYAYNGSFISPTYE